MLVACNLPVLTTGSQAVITLTLQSGTPSNYSLSAELLWFDDTGAQVSDAFDGNNLAQTWLNVVSLAARQRAYPPRELATASLALALDLAAASTSNLLVTTLP